MLVGLSSRAILQGVCGAVAAGLVALLAVELDQLGRIGTKWSCSPGGFRRIQLVSGHGHHSSSTGSPWGQLPFHLPNWAHAGQSGVPKVPAGSGPGFLVSSASSC